MLRKKYSYILTQVDNILKITEHLEMNDLYSK